MSNKEKQITNYMKHMLSTCQRMPTAKELISDCNIGRGSLNRIINRMVKKKKLVKTVRGIPYDFNLNRK